jgi:hypothetical protein
VDFDFCCAGCLYNIELTLAEWLSLLIVVYYIKLVLVFDFSKVYFLYRKYKTPISVGVIALFIVGAYRKFFWYHCFQHAQGDPRS